MTPTHRASVPIVYSYTSVLGAPKDLFCYKLLLAPCSHSQLQGCKMDSKSDCVICEIVKIANRDLCYLRKLRIFIFRIFLMNQLEFGQNNHRGDALHFSYDLDVSFLVHFYPNMKFKYEKFWRSRIQFRLTIFSENIE